MTAAILSSMTVRSGKGKETERQMPTNLEACDMRFADLSGANFSNATLTKADLRSVIRKRTVFTGAALDGVLVTA